MTSQLAPHSRQSASWRILALVVVGATLASWLVVSSAIAQDDEETSIVGEYAVTIARTDIPTDVAGAFSYMGRWRMSINADGTYQVERLDVGVVVEGTYTVDGDQITFTDESGLLSCANPAAVPFETQDLVSGTYTWTKTGSNLTLTRVDDSCPGRVILMSTLGFGAFVACVTEPLAAVASPVGSPELQPTEVPVFEPTEDSPLAVLTPEGALSEPATPETADAPGREIEFAPEIDALLSQMTACWANGEPERWLPLLSTEFRQALSTSDPAFLDTLTAAMSSPIVWERAGDIEVETPGQVTAIVRSTVGAEEDFQRFVFVFEDGEWKWNG